MAKGRGCITCGCIVPLILLVVIVGGVFGAYMLLPIGTTFGIADEPIILGKSMRDLGIEDKSLRDLLNKPIGELGKLSSEPLLGGLSLGDDLGLESVSLRDLTKKPINELGGLGDVEFFRLLENFSDVNLAGESSSSGGTPSMEDIMGEMEGCTLNALGLGGERLVDLSFGTIRSLVKGESDFITLFPLFNKKIGQLGDGKFKETNFFDFISNEALEGIVDDMLVDVNMGLTAADLELDGLQLKIKDFTFKSGTADILEMTLMDLFSDDKLSDIDVDEVFDTVLQSAVDGLLIDEETIKDTIIEDEFKEGNFDKQSELNNIKNEMTGTDGSGIPVKEGTEEPDFTEVFKDVVVFDERKQITIKDTELTAMFQDVIENGGDLYGDLKALSSQVKQVVLSGYIAELDQYHVKITLSIKTSELKNAGYDFGMAEKFMPAYLYITVNTVISADQFGEVTFDGDLSTSRIENLNEKMSAEIMATPIGGDTFGKQMEDMVGNMFCTFMNNLGFVGTKNGDTVTLGNVGLDTARQISLVTRIESDIAQGGQEAA